jgi:hypothetical protein
MSWWWIVAGALWWLSGYASIVYWWTRKLDMTLADAFLCISLACAGPPMFLLMWLAFAPPPWLRNPVIWKKRGTDGT